MIWLQIPAGRPFSFWMCHLLPAQLNIPPELCFDSHSLLSFSSLAFSLNSLYFVPKPYLSIYEIQNAIQYRFIITALGF
jgi:hypothetical protein